MANIPKEEPGDEPDDVLFNSLYGVRTIELNRPKKLNSLNGSMARKIIPRLKVPFSSFLSLCTLCKHANQDMSSNAGMGEISTRIRHYYGWHWRKSLLCGRRCGSACTIQHRRNSRSGAFKGVFRPRIPTRPPDCHLSQTLHCLSRWHHNGGRSRTFSTRPLSHRHGKDNVRHARNDHRILP